MPAAGVATKPLVTLVKQDRGPMFRNGPSTNPAAEAQDTETSVVDPAEYAAIVKGKAGWVLLTEVLVFGYRIV